MVSDDCILNDGDINVPCSGIKKNLCVVGAGAAGLCALRHFNTKSDLFNIECYEQTDNIGGTWKYDQNIGFDDDGLPVHSSMYKNLHTNLPMEIMEFPDYRSNTPNSYVHHSEVLAYLARYTHHHNLFPYIKFKHRIINIKRLNDQWSVTVEDVKQRKEFTKLFDIVIICTGRYSIPSWPKYDTLKLFKGTMIHSHDYRIPDVYTGQTIAVVGGGLSGVDISVEIAKNCREVIFINKNKHFQNMPDNVRQINVQIEKFGPDSITVKNLRGDFDTYRIDGVIMATGYHYNMRFVDPNCGISMASNGTINGLFRHMINIEYPSMALLAVTNKVLPLPLYHQQMLYFLKIQLNQYKLPTKDEMIKDTEEDYQKRLSEGMRPKDRHELKVDLMSKYLDKITNEAQLKPLKKVIIKLHRDLYAVRLADITGYKRFNYRLISDDDYEVIERADLKSGSKRIEANGFLCKAPATETLKTHGQMVDLSKN